MRLELNRRKEPTPADDQQIPVLSRPVETRDRHYVSSEIADIVLGYPVINHQLADHRYEAVKILARGDARAIALIGNPALVLALGGRLFGPSKNA